MGEQLLLTKLREESRLNLARLTDLFQNQLALRSKTLLPYELCAFRALAGCFEDQIASQLMAQVSNATICREFSGMFVRINNKSKTPVLLQNQYIELIAAYAFITTEKAESIRADLFVSEGQIVALYFNKPPLALLGKSNDAYSATKLAELSLPFSQTWHPANSMSLDDLLIKLGLNPSLTTIRKPRPTQEVQLFLDRFSDSMRSDWEGLLAQTNGIRCGFAEFAGTLGRTITYSGSRSLQLYAERDDTRLGLGFFEDEGMGRIYLVNEEMGSEELFPGRLVEALRHFFAQSELLDSELKKR